jgi:3-deoxy-manno-octulosonate cytidylyltransferase (CMP-KDO synthetase)
MSIVAIIPARYSSTRFPGKPLIDLNGKTMIERVWEATMQSQLINHVAVATDNETIAEICKRIGAECIMTSSELVSGTDRVAEAMNKAYTDSTIVLNVQGDEPLLHHSVLDDMITALTTSSADVATPITDITSLEELENPTICKVALRTDGTALYFSRSVIPHGRGIERTELLSSYPYKKHIGLYAYTSDAIKRFSQLQPHPLELSESLEQLRLLADGAVYSCVHTNHQLVAIDTPADAEKVRMILRERNS